MELSTTQSKESMQAVKGVVEFEFPTTPTKEDAMGCVSVRAKDANPNGLILAIDLGKCKGVLRVYEPSEPSWQMARFATSQARLHRT